ncbi:hydroxyphenylacetyl-CoA thioesterase PaaI [Thiomonas sp.]|uniref:hydroxyphenylacetyl-CoA thioesterase PaaI n=1 Tax=Thiomonas sp. TaxID=2047785 RepID=UPI0026385A27|nr:hydroxyphenylacetyl-CoA thioesterase PaaI [Thiomonas sp.]
MHPSETADDATATRVALRVRETMLADDHASRSLGIDIAEVAPGRALARMRVRRDMLNGFGICHGGLITTLADTAFAYACNSANHVTVAAGVSVDFVAPAHEGDELSAACEQRTQQARTGVYDVVVRNQHGHTVALMRGRSHRLKGRQVFVDGDAALG